MLACVQVQHELAQGAFQACQWPALFPEEIRLGFREMARVKIADDRLTFDPRVPTPPAPSLSNP